jgi:glycosyltransferase involved in cell wall biosynthesis
MPYFQRQAQLDRTIDTLLLSKYKNFNVVIVDDCSPNPVVVPKLPFDIKVIRLNQKMSINVAPIYNIGFREAIQNGAEIVIIQSPECYHVGDVISKAAEVGSDNYMTFACFRFDRTPTIYKYEIEQVLEYRVKDACTPPNEFGINFWWHHSEYGVNPFYWCASITAKNLIKLNGIDERFSDGYASEDGYFLDQIKRLRLKIDIIDYPFVVHQWHKPPNIPDVTLKQLTNKNFQLWQNLSKENRYRAIHTLTPDLG